MLGNVIKVPCPHCKGSGQAIVRVQYRDHRGCRNEMRDCLICHGFKEISMDEAAEFERKFGARVAQGKSAEASK